jgi:uncharacterized phage-like protein YoqJ
MTSTNGQWKIVAGTGHRPQYLSGQEAAWARAQLPGVLRRLRGQHNTQIIVSGMALGWDMWLAQAALDEGLELHAHIPFPQQPDPWTEPAQRLHADLVSRAANVVTYGTAYSVQLLHARNDGMLAAADAVLALWDESKTKGGTHSTIMKAIELGLPIIHLDPVGQTIDRLARIPRRPRPPAPPALS